MINYFDDGGEASGVLAMGEEDNAADFDEAPLGGLDLYVCHYSVAIRKLYQYLDSITPEVVIAHCWGNVRVDVVMR